MLHRLRLCNLQVDAKVVRPGSGSQAKQDYWGAQILVNADGQDFDTFMAALNSSRCEKCDVMLIVERQKGAESKVRNSQIAWFVVMYSTGVTCMKSPACLLCMQEHEKHNQYFCVLLRCHILTSCHRHIALM